MTTGIFSRATSSAIAAASGFISMMLTPKGLSVNSRQRRICCSSWAVVIPPLPMRPRAPALDTAAANSPVAMLAIPPWIKGNSVPSMSVQSHTSLPHHSSRAPPQV